MNAKRKETLKLWIKAGANDDTYTVDDVMWGVWFDVNGDEYKPPYAVFREKSQAEAFAVLVGADEYAVEPVIAEFEFRDNFDVPTEEP